jgi:hypothetical protein
MDLEGIVSIALREWQNAGMAEDAGVPSERSRPCRVDLQLAHPMISLGDRSNTRSRRLAEPSPIIPAKQRVTEMIRVIIGIVC